MPERDAPGDTYFKLIIGLAVILAGIIFFYKGQQMFFGGGGGRERGSRPKAHRPLPDDDSTHLAPTRIPPMKLLRIEGGRKKARSAPPAAPLPPITPDRP